MSMIRHNEGHLVVGVDLGGTQIRVLALTDGRPCGRYQGPTTDENGLGNLLRKLWKRQQWSARTVAALVVAAKGIWTEGERRSLAQRTGQQWTHETREAARLHGDPERRGRWIRLGCRP